MKHGSELILNGEIILSGYVTADGDAQWMGDGGFICPQQVREALASINGAATIRLSSDGGNPFAGESIRATMAGHPGGVTCIVEGMAASAASLIFMGAAKRVMSEGSMLMIHDPSTLVWGTQEELLKQAEVTGQIADVYAAVYAKAAGISPEDARNIMRAETFFSAQEAVDAGFAHEIAGAAEAPVASMEVARAAVMKMRQGMAVMAARKHSGQPETPAAAGGSPANEAKQKEVVMSDKTTAAVETADKPIVTMAAPDAQALVAAERTRVKMIREMARPFAAQVAETEIDAMIEDGTTVDDASKRILASMAAQTKHIPTARIVRDEKETQTNGMIEALMGKFDGPGAEFRGLRLKSLAMHLAGDKRSFNEAETVRAGMVQARMTGGAFGVSDFSYITANVMNRTLRAEYERRAATWTMVAGAPIQAADFRQIAIARFGGDFQLKKVMENGEYQATTLGDDGDVLKVERRGRTINLTFEAVINDDMGALTRVPTEFAMQARVMENSMVWALIRGNSATSSDGLALFHATHKNLAGAGAVISATTVGAARKAMWEQRALGVKDSDDFIQIEPDRLIVPPALEVAALQFATATTPATDANVNPFKGTLTPVVVPNIGAAASGGSDTAWYLVSSSYPPVSVAYLDGYDAPTVTAVQGMNPDLTTYTARHIFGAANTEWRGAYKNPGA